MRVEAERDGPDYTDYTGLVMVYVDADDLDRWQMNGCEFNAELRMELVLNNVAASQAFGKLGPVLAEIEANADPA